MGVPRLTKKIVARFNLELLTGMRIGASDPGIAIGAIDAPVIRDPLTNEPYIPGSSLKGKLRSCLERVRGDYELDANGNALPSQKLDSVSAMLFGVSADKPEAGARPSRLTVRDSFLTIESREKFRSAEFFLDSQFGEVKTENSIDRLTGGVSRVGGLRTFERVPRGAEFSCEMVLSIWDTDGDGKELCEALSKCLTLLETEYLGGSGTRGYGQVMVLPKDIVEIKFVDGAILVRKLEDWGDVIPFKSLLHGDSRKEIGPGAA
ncbi:MAG: type III-A CRISPR-associated RAMP protein Csm3 [bacterium]|jgi:CRISPR-associated protein Csm3